MAEIKYEDWHNSEETKKLLRDIDNEYPVPQNNSIGYFYRGRTKFDKGLLEEAIEDFNKAEQYEKNYCEEYVDSEGYELDGFSMSDLYYLRGVSKSYINLEEEAIEDFNKVLELCPGEEWTLFHRGSSKLELKMYEEAIEDFDKALENTTTFDKNTEDKLVEACYQRGYAKYKLGRLKEAQEDYEKVKEIGLYDNYETYDKEQ